jgi:GTP pyrophosphokinase
VETNTFETDESQQAAVTSAYAALAPLTTVAAPEVVERALGIARIVAQFDPDPVALGGTMLEAIQSAGTEGAREALVSLDPSTVSFARALARFGRLESPVRDTLTAAQAEALRRMLLAVVADPRLVLARVAEQLWRLRAARAACDEERRRLGRQTQELYAPLANRLGLATLKWELEDYAFRYLEPDEYRRIAAALAERRTDRERYITDLRATLVAALKAAGITADVTGRPKHIYSIWRKMQRKGLRFDELNDIRAVRILTQTVAECYAALGVVHGLWPYLPGEFDDYIATPKVNGYRSIHTAVTGPQGRIVEVQIRTADMHARAEQGVAAHWRYKEGVREHQALERKIAELRRLLTPDANGDDDPLARVGASLLRDHVYVFSPKGDVVELTAGATPLDFAYHVHTRIGHRCRGARVDGRMVPLDHRLTSGETVEIITAKEPQPSRDWLVESLGFLASKSARAKVRAWFREQDRDEHLRAGRAIVERELARRSNTGPLIEALSQDLGLADATALYVALGAGDLSAAQLAAALQRKERVASNATPAPVKATTDSAPEAASGVQVMGVGDLLSHYARCCGPIPPEPVLGYVTLGRGVTLHREGCRNLARLRAKQPDRVLPVAWGAERHELHGADVTVRAFDRRGLVRDVSAVLSDQKLSIERMTTHVRTDGIADMSIRVRVRDLTELETTLARIRAVADVMSAERT